MIQRSIKLFIQLSKLLNKVKYKPTQFQKTIQAKFHLKTYTVSSLKVNKGRIEVVEKVTTISGRFHSSQNNSYQAKFFFIHAMIFSLLLNANVK